MLYSHSDGGRGALTKEEAYLTKEEADKVHHMRGTPTFDKKVETLVERS